MDSGGASWAIITIVGPLLMLAVFAWALMRNKKKSKTSIEETEQATRELYRKEDAAHRNDDTFGT